MTSSQTDCKLGEVRPKIDVVKQTSIKYSTLTPEWRKGWKGLAVTEVMKKTSGPHRNGAAQNDGSQREKASWSESGNGVRSSQIPGQEVGGIRGGNRHSRPNSRSEGRR